jgi:hypothetical protein
MLANRRKRASTGTAVNENSTGSFGCFWIVPRLPLSGLLLSCQRLLLGAATCFGGYDTFEYVVVFSSG